MDNRKISTLVGRQLPEFIRSDHQSFVLFLEKYYEWTEQNNNVLNEIEHLRNSKDIDTANDYYIDLMIDNLLPYFPKNMESDRKSFLKHVHDFYSRKGSEESLKYAFRAFYGEETEVYYPKHDILKVSDGKWLLPLALRIDTDDVNILNIEKTKLTGLTSKATALVEKVQKSVDRQLGIEYNEVYISNIEKYFQTGETVTSTYYDNLGLPVTVSGRLVGSLSEIKINPKHRGLYYVGYDADNGYDGDPVTIVSGLNPVASNPVGAIATVGETTKGAVVDVLIVDGGLGFRKNDGVDISYANTIIDFQGGYASTTLINSVQEAQAEITLVDESVSRNVSITSTTINEIYTESIANIANIYGTLVSANTVDANSNTIHSISDYESLSLYPISFITLSGGGGGYREKPLVDVYSFYNESLGENIIGTEDSPKLFSVASGSNVLTTSYTGLITVYGVEKGDLIRFTDIEGRTHNIKEVESVTEIGYGGGVLNTITVTEEFVTSITGLKAYKLNKRDIRTIGSLGRLDIIDGGTGYSVGDTIIFTGGSGYGANANVTSVGALGEIIEVTMQYHSSNAYVRGGEGYRMDSLPIITVDSLGGANASISASEILGDGENLELSTSRIGSITSLRIQSYGYDYISAPRISLRNMDMTTTNVSSGLLFVSNTKVYQGSSNSSTSFSAYVDQYDSTTGFLRLFDYQGSISNTKLLISDDGLVSANVDGFIVYGDGKAKADAIFENGLIRLPGIYINNDGHISSDKYIQDGDKYHNFSYVVGTTHNYSDFKLPMKNIFHPVGMKSFVIKNDFMSSNVAINSNSSIIKVFSIDNTTFNIAENSNTIISTNSSVDLTETVNVGDTIVLTGLLKVLDGTANIANQSNTVVGTNSNYIGSLNDDDFIILSTDPTDTSNTNYVVSSESVILKSGTNDITEEFVRDFIHYCTGQYVPEYFKSFIEQRIDGRLMGDIVNNGDIGIINPYRASQYQQNIDILDEYESWIENYIIPYLNSDIAYSEYIVNRPTPVTNTKMYFVSDTVTVEDENVFLLGNSSPVTANNLYVKLIYTDMVEVVNVSATQIVVSQNMKSTSNNNPGIIHKST